MTQGDAPDEGQVAQEVKDENGKKEKKNKPEKDITEEQMLQHEPETESSPSIVLENSQRNKRKKDDEG